MNAMTADDGADPADTLALVAAELSAGRTEAAAALIGERYPRVALARRHDSRARSAERPVPSAPRPPTTPSRRLALFRRDGFVDRYTGRRLVYPSALYAIADALPDAFPMLEGRADSHQAHRDLFPTLDHVRALAAGGMRAEANWVTTSMTVSLDKGTRSRESPGWRVREPSEDASWDGLLGWYVDYARSRPQVSGLRFDQGWHRAAADLGRGPSAGSGIAA